MTDRILTVEDLEGDHSPLGPSGADRWINCPGSYQCTRGIRDESSSYAIEGTAAHAVAEACDKQEVAASHFLDWTVRVSRDGKHTDVPVTWEMVDAVQTFLDYVDEFPGDNLNESQVRYTDLVPEGFGTLDRAKIGTYVVHIFDFKYGQGVPVEAEDNAQMKLYALGFLQDYGWLADDLKSFVLHVVQPRLSAISSWPISWADLVEWGEKVVRPAAQEALHAKTPTMKAGKWCTFCKIRATCTVRASAVFSEVVGDFKDLDSAVDDVELLGPAFALTPDQAARVLKVLPQIKSWCSDLEAYAMAELQAGRKIGDWKLVEGKSNRVWNKADDEVAKELLAAGVKEDQLYKPREIVGPAPIEKILGKKNEVLKSLCTKPKGKPTLAPGDDKRPALTVDAASEFADLDSGE